MDAMHLRQVLHHNMVVFCKSFYKGLRPDLRREKLA